MRLLVTQQLFTNASENVTGIRKSCYEYDSDYLFFCHIVF